MGRADSLVKLAWAYGKHTARRRLTRSRSQVDSLLRAYAADGIVPLTEGERARHPELIGCINCGLCALAAGRLGRTRMPDLASAYMRLYARVGEASFDVSGEEADFVAAAAACPVGVPLAEVAALVRRISAG